MGLLQNLLHLTNFRNPLLRTVVPGVATAFAMQAAFGLPSVVAQSERVYDASGALTFLSVTALSLYLPSLRARAVATPPPPPLPSLLSAFSGAGAGAALNWRQVTLSAAVAFWSIRCACCARAICFSALPVVLERPACVPSSSVPPRDNLLPCL